MRWWEILLTIQGYRRRNVLQYQLQRITAWASAFCMGNKNNVQPQDFLHLYIDDYISDGEDEEISDDEIEEIRRQIFAPFFSTSRGKSGIGHGLAVCRGLVREMGGRIFLERGDPGSTVFTVRLPFIPCRPESDD